MSRNWIVAAAVVLAIAIVAIATGVLRLTVRMKAKQTVTRIRDLSTMLLAEQPSQISAATLEGIASKYRRMDVLRDGWGRPLVVSVSVVGGERQYVVTSYARDGRAGGCCVDAAEATPDTDLIAVNGRWRQVWN